MSDEKLQFDELGISMGQMVEALPKNDPEKVFSEVVMLGAIPNEALIIAPPPSGLFPKMAEGERVIIRLKLADGVAIFTSTVLFVADVPMFMVYLDFPQEISFKRIRNASRVSVKLPILVSNRNDKQYSGITGQITDISTTGAGLLLSEFAGDKGDELVVKGKFAVGSIRRVLTINGIVRMVKETKSNTLIYGVEFLEEDENDLLVLFGFIFNAMAFGKIQKIR
tara:strand:- start:7 stop:678 length:672 start_codon:yes stop_codon:yes gene_type:complete